MVTIKLHNTKSRTKAVFTPIDATNVRMYVCGPTVYDRAHLGNARPVVVFDVLYRLLRHVYGADHVTYVRNFTDVDDKINATAQSRKAAGDPRSLEALIHERTEETIGWYHADMDALGALPPTEEPRATAFIPQMVTMIASLINSGHAYERQGHVLFRVRSYKEYGALSGRSIDDMIAGARVEVAPYKEDPMDFVLWKPSDADLPGWDSPWGKGRPGWHIECSAMSYELLGAHFDIHGGGLDLQFPHHENEIAQSACAHPGEGFANVWMHNEMLQVEGKKMSKSLGNFFTVRELLDQGVPGEVIRFVLLGTHYGKPMDWTKEKAEQAEATLWKWRSLVNGVEASGSVDKRVLELLADDLNTAGALARLHELAKDISGAAAGDRSLEKGVFVASALALGLLGAELGGWEMQIAREASVAELIAELLSTRGIARSTKDWVRADIIRDGFKRAGIRISDGVGGSNWTIEKDEIDSSEYFHSVRAVFLSDHTARLEAELKRAHEAGIEFSDHAHLDVSPAWRGVPSDDHIRRELELVQERLMALK